MKTGTLYLIATPIGNLADLSLRALQTLPQLDVLLCEDTRHTGLLLQKYQIKKPKLISYQEFNEQQKIPQIIGYLNQGAKVGLVTDAGTPLITDPGYNLVKECLKRKIKVTVLPGPTALISALIISGLPTHSFYFGGYLPKNQTKQLKLLKNLVNASSHFPSQTTFIFYETPHRLTKTLSNLQTVFGNISLVIVRELTKIHEEIFQGKINEALKHFTKPQGEFVILFSL